MAPPGLAGGFRGLVAHHGELKDARTKANIDSKTELVARYRHIPIVGDGWLLNYLTGIAVGSEPCTLLLENGTSFRPGSSEDGHTLTVTFNNLVSPRTSTRILC